MVVDLIGIYGLKGPYCTLTTTNWFLQAQSMIPRGSWRDVARRITMIRWAIVGYGQEEEGSTMVEPRPNDWPHAAYVARPLYTLRPSRVSHVIEHAKTLGSLGLNGADDDPVDFMPTSEYPRLDTQDKAQRRKDCGSDGQGELEACGGGEGKEEYSYVSIINLSRTTPALEYNQFSPELTPTNSFHPKLETTGSSHLHCASASACAQQQHRSPEFSTEHCTVPPDRLHHLSSDRILQTGSRCCIQLAANQTACDTLSDHRKLGAAYSIHSCTAYRTDQITHTGQLARTQQISSKLELRIAFVLPDGYRYLLSKLKTTKDLVYIGRHPQPILKPVNKPNILCIHRNSQLVYNLSNSSTSSLTRRQLGVIQSTKSNNNDCQLSMQHKCRENAWKVPRKVSGLKDQLNSWEYNIHKTNQQLEEQNSQKQLNNRSYMAHRTTPRLEVQNSRHDSTAKHLEIHNSSGHRAWEDVVAIHSSQHAVPGAKIWSTVPSISSDPDCSSLGTFTHQITRPPDRAYRSDCTPTRSHSTQFSSELRHQISGPAQLTLSTAYTLTTIIRLRFQQITSKGTSDQLRASSSAHTSKMIPSWTDSTGCSH
ncbi:hypothetical protein F511_19315 [Dorcoceras hygrometricum]|uniref:Uncharacterized protein n=1 Tax=Dorcoceras hygrometricum TaxID=472368 RepID=A0A2Z7BJ58_9LAMI|nr:hypothetical protein F511_19315 [Dorcoceras hygrometricum]